MLKSNKNALPCWWGKEREEFMNNYRMTITAQIDTAYGPISKQAVIPGYALDIGKETLKAMVTNSCRALEKAIMEDYERLEHANNLEV